jgi:hypothetical protein
VSKAFFPNTGLVAKGIRLLAVGTFLVAAALPASSATLRQSGSTGGNGSGTTGGTGNYQFTFYDIGTGTSVGSNPNNSSPPIGDTIFSNLTSGNTYNTTIGGIGVLSPPGGEALAQLFTSAGNYKVTQIDIALLRQFGTNSAVISLWTDSAGQPGTELGSWTVSGFPTIGSVSTPTASMAGGQIISGITGVSLSAGQSYFLIAAPTSASSNTALTWFQETNVASPNSYFQFPWPSGSWTQSGDPDGAYAIFGTPNFGEPGGDNVLRLIDPNGCGNAGVCGSVTDLCAMFYVFDDDQEMGECCGCPITPGGLNTYSVRDQLVNNWALPSQDNSRGTIVVVSSNINDPGSPGSPAPGTGFNDCGNPNNPACYGGCDPTRAPITTGASNLLGSMTHDQVVGMGNNLTETELYDQGAGDPSNNAYLVAQCAALIGNSHTNGAFCHCGDE